MNRPGWGILRAPFCPILVQIQLQTGVKTKEKIRKNKGKIKKNKGNIKEVYLLKSIVPTFSIQNVNILNFWPQIRILRKISCLQGSKQKKIKKNEEKYVFHCFSLFFVGFPLVFLGFSLDCCKGRISKNTFQISTNPPNFCSCEFPLIWPLIELAFKGLYWRYV